MLWAAFTSSVQRGMDTDKKTFLNLYYQVCISKCLHLERTVLAPHRASPFFSTCQLVHQTAENSPSREELDVNLSPTKPVSARLSTLETSLMVLVRPYFLCWHLCVWYSFYGRRNFARTLETFGCLLVTLVGLGFQMVLQFHPVLSHWVETRA